MTDVSLHQCGHSDIQEKITFHTTCISRKSYPLETVVRLQNSQDNDNSDDDEDDPLSCDVLLPMANTTGPCPGDGQCKDTTEYKEEDDQISQLVGEFGRWQLQLTFLLSLFNIPCTFHIFALTFQSPKEVDFWCARPEGLTDMPVENWRNISHGTTLNQQEKIVFDSCHVWNLDYTSANNSVLQRAVADNSSIPCTSWEYDTTTFGDTIISQWDLVCSKENLPNVAEMMFLAGVAIGGLVSGMVSDRFGRKRTLMGSLVIQISIALLMTFCPWFELFLLLRFCLGFISVGIVFSGFVLCMELVGGKWRTVSGVSYLFPVPLSYIAIAGIAYLIRGWKNLQLAITLPSILLFGLWWILPESPRWLLTTGRTEEVMAILREAARVNKRTLPDNADKQIMQIMGKRNPEEQERKAGIIDLFRSKTMRKTSFLLYIIWFSDYFVYYGLVLNLGNIGGDVYINTVLSGVVEIPAIAISILFLLKMGRRWPLCLTLVGSGVACLLTLPVPLDSELEWITITMAMIGKFAVSAANAVMPVFTAELFPTVVRNLGVGASNVSAGIALMLVPYIWNLSSMDARVPMGVIGALGIIGGISVLFLPETANRPLVGTLEENENAIARRASIRPTQRNSTELSNGSVCKSSAG